MADIVAAQDLFLNADQDACVTLKSGDAAYLLARKGRNVPRIHHQLVTKKGKPKQAAKAKTKEAVAAEDKGSD